MIGSTVEYCGCNVFFTVLSIGFQISAPTYSGCFPHLKNMHIVWSDAKFSIRLNYLSARGPHLTGNQSAQCVACFLPKIRRDILQLARKPNVDKQYKKKLYLFHIRMNWNGTRQMAVIVYRCESKQIESHQSYVDCHFKPIKQHIS